MYFLASLKVLKRLTAGLQHILQGQGHAQGWYDDDVNISQKDNILSVFT